MLTNVALADANSFYIKPMFCVFYPIEQVDVKVKKTPVIGIALGYIINDKIRMDIGIERFSNIKHSAILEDHCSNYPYPPERIAMEVCSYTKITTAKVNLYVDFIKINNISIYAGIGIGMSQITRTFTQGEERVKFPIKTDMTYSNYLGVSHEINKNLDLEIGYSYMHLTENTYNDKGSAVFSSIRIGL